MNYKNSYIISYLIEFQVKYKTENAENLRYARPNSWLDINQMSQEAREKKHYHDDHAYLVACLSVVLLKWRMGKI